MRSWAALLTFIVLSPAGVWAQVAPANVLREPERAAWFFAGTIGPAAHWVGDDDRTLWGFGVGVRGAAGWNLDPRVSLFVGAAHFESNEIELHQRGGATGTSNGILAAKTLFFGGRLYTRTDFFVEATVGGLRVEVQELWPRGPIAAAGPVFFLCAGREWLTRAGLTLVIGARYGRGRVPDRGGNHLSADHLELQFGFGYSARR